MWLCDGSTLRKVEYDTTDCSGAARFLSNCNAKDSSHIGEGTFTDYCSQSSGCEYIVRTNYEEVTSCANETGTTFEWGYYWTNVYPVGICMRSVSSSKTYMVVDGNITLNKWNSVSDCSGDADSSYPLIDRCSSYGAQVDKTGIANNTEYDPTTTSNSDSISLIFAVMMAVVAVINL